MVQITGFQPSQEIIDKAKPSFEPFNGKHLSMLVSVKEDNGNDKWEFDIQSGPYQGRKVWLNLDFNGDETWKVQKAEAYLSEMFFATGFQPKQFTSEFEGQCVVLDLYVDKKGYQRVRQIMPSSTPVDTQAVPAQQTAPAQQTQAAAPSQTHQASAPATNTPPWKR